MPHREALFKHLGIDYLAHEVQDIVSDFMHPKYGIYQIQNVTSRNPVIIDNRPIIISGIFFLKIDKEIVPVGFCASNVSQDTNTRTDQLNHWIPWQPVPASRIQKQMNLTPSEREKLAKGYCSEIGVDYDKNLPAEQKTNGAELFIKDLFEFYEGRVQNMSEGIRTDENLRELYRKSVHELIKYALDNAYGQKT